MACMMSSYDLLHILRNEQIIRFAWKCFLSQYDAAVSQWSVNNYSSWLRDSNDVSDYAENVFFLIFFIVLFIDANIHIFVHIYTNQIFRPTRYHIVD